MVSKDCCKLKRPQPLKQRNLRGDILAPLSTAPSQLQPCPEGTSFGLDLHTHDSTHACRDNSTGTVQQSYLVPY